MTAIPSAVRRAVLIRADGMCERCGAWSRLELHHRLFRSRGGQHTVSNLVALCGFGNHTGCHGFAHDHSNDAEKDGWSIASGGNPEGLAIHVGDSWFFLPATGKRVRCTSGEAVTALANAGSLHIKGIGASEPESNTGSNMMALIYLTHPPVLGQPVTKGVGNE